MDQKSISNAGAQIVYFSHGGGPLPILGDPGHKAMIDFMTALPEKACTGRKRSWSSARIGKKESPPCLALNTRPCSTIITASRRNPMRLTTRRLGARALVDMVTGALQKNGFPCAVGSGARVRSWTLHPAEIDVSPGRYSHHPAFAHPGTGCGNTHQSRESTPGFASIGKCPGHWIGFFLPQYERVFLAKPGCA